MRSITGCGVVGSTSVELARSRPHTWRANSMTAICIPKQMPRKGIFCSRAQRTAVILPSVPRGPKPIGTRIASASHALREPVLLDLLRVDVGDLHPALVGDAA